MKELTSATKSAIFRDVESRIKQGLARAGLDGLGATLADSTESEASATYAESGSAIRPYTQGSNFGTIIAEEGRLIERAQKEGFFWDAEKVSAVISLARATGGGSEHDVYYVGTSPHRVVIRSTIKDSYGYAFRSPAQYLKRLEDNNTVFPETQIRMIGVSQNARGNGVIWTVQPFVEGKHFKEESQVQRELESRGWLRMGSGATYRHNQAGVIMSDAHAGNIIVNGQELFPVDVHIDSLGSANEPSSSARAV